MRFRNQCYEPRSYQAWLIGEQFPNYNMKDTHLPWFKTDPLFQSDLSCPACRAASSSTGSRSGSPSMSEVRHAPIHLYSLLTMELILTPCITEPLPRGSRDSEGHLYSRQVPPRYEHCTQGLEARESALHQKRLVANFLVFLVLTS